MTGRDPTEAHRASTPLELFFDLSFVVAVAAGAAELHHGLAEGHLGTLLGYAFVFFAVWWAWMNYSWFASAYDTGDVVFRLLTFVIMAGVLVLAARCRTVRRGASGVDSWHADTCRALWAVHHRRAVAKCVARRKGSRGRSTADGVGVAGRRRRSPAALDPPAIADREPRELVSGLAIAVVAIGIAFAGLDLGLTVLLIGLVMVGAVAHHLTRSPVARRSARA